MPGERWAAAVAGGSIQIGGLRLRPPIYVDRDASLQKAASTMRAEGISSLVVDSQPVSFVTERDLVQALADGRDLSEPVSTVATRAPVWIPPTLSVAHAAALMVGLGVRHLLVVDERGEISGVLSIRDAFDVLLPALEPDGWVATFAMAMRDVG